MISNKYNFIFMHTPKTGGTSINTALHRDLEEECTMITASEYDNLNMKELPKSNYSDEITHIFPSNKDFPWWRHLAMGQVLADQNLQRALRGAEEKRGLQTGSLGFFMDIGTIQLMFGLGGYQGNIKHVPYLVWVKALNDRRLQYYRSFNENYYTIGTARNPYKREFSVFLYFRNKNIEEKIKGFKTAQYSKLIQEEWKEWTSNWSTQESSESLNYGPRHPHGYGSQCSFLCAPDRNNPAELERVGTLIKMENIEEDYSAFCEKVGMKKKGPVPHLLSMGPRWKKYLPENILDWYTDDNLKDIHRIRSHDFDVLGYKRVNEDG